MAAIVDKADESKKAESTPVENSSHIDDSIMKSARVKGAVAIAIAKLQPTVRLLIAYAKLWAYYTMIPFKVGQLTIDVVVLGLEITKLFLIAVKANTNVFVQLFQQILAIFSPDFIQNLLLTSSQVLTTLVEKMMKDFLDAIQKIVDGMANIFKPPFMPLGGKGIFKSPEASGMLTEPTSEGVAPQNPRVNGETADKSEKSTPKKG